jgi:ubiquinone/menaquinone biosynthesis C-methylase UbiE
MENNKNFSQEQVWNALAEPWSRFRKYPPVEVREFLKDKKGKILDLGCGSGRNIIKIENANFYGIDFSEKLLKFAEEKIKKEQINAILFKTKCSELPFENNFFDNAIFICVLHCIESSEERKKAVQELFRVLKPNAKAMISVWDKETMKILKNTNAKEGFVNWKNNNHNYKRYYYFYDEKELKQLLESVGFKITKIKKSQDSGKHSRRNIIFYCEK